MPVPAGEGRARARSPRTEQFWSPVPVPPKHRPAGAAGVRALRLGAVGEVQHDVVDLGGDAGHDLVGAMCLVSSECGSTMMQW